MEGVAKIKVSEFPTMMIKTKELGGWVGDNYWSMFYLAPWVFQFLDSDYMETSAPTLPKLGTQPASWKKGEMEAWLRVRSVSTAKKMVKAELLTLILRCLADEASAEIRPELLTEDRVW
jgi:hypothetical protein